MFDKLITNKCGLALAALLITSNSATSVAAAFNDDISPISTRTTAAATCPCQAFYTLDSVIPEDAAGDTMDRRNWCTDDEIFPFGIRSSDDVYAVFDTVCIVNDFALDITKAEANACKELLIDTCQKKAKCQCSGFSNLTRDLLAPTVTIDRNRSCKSDTSDDAFGVYATTTSPGFPPLTYTVGDGSCFEIDLIADMNSFDTQACKDDLQEFCDDLPPPSTPPTELKPKSYKAKSSKREEL